MGKNSSDWIPKGQVVAELGISERSLERLIQKKRIRRAYRKVPGRKPLPVLHPDDVKQFKQELLPALPDNGQKKPQLPISTMTKAADIVATMAAINNVRVPVEKKFYLTLRGAAELSGLPKSYIRRLIGEGTLPALRAGGYRIRRSDLEQL